jgi:pimeloyl-ACP methyl ester carboxylesterase
LIPREPHHRGLLLHLAPAADHGDRGRDVDPAAAATAAAGWGAAHVASNADRCVHPPRTRLTERDRSAARTRFPGLEDVELRTRDGLVLRGWFAPGIRRTAVVLVHGLGANRTAMLPEAGILAAHGHGVLLFDSRASGESDGALATWGDRERLDVAAAVDLLAARPDVDPSRLGAYGYSVGSSAVALAAGQDPRLRAVLLGPVWPSLDAELGAKFHRFGWVSATAARLAFRASGVNVDAVRPVDIVGSIPPRPLMLVSGSDDTDTPPPVMARVHRAVPASEWWLVPGADHVEHPFAKVAGAEYDRRFAAFFDASL